MTTLNPLVGLLLALFMTAGSKIAAAQQPGGQLRYFKGHSRPIRAVVYSPNGKSIISAGFDSTIKVWDSATGKVVRSIDEHIRPVLALAVSSDGLQLASGSLNGQVKLFDMPLHYPLKSFLTSKSTPTLLTISADGKFLFTGLDTKQIQLWNQETGTAQANFKGMTDQITALAFLQSTKHLVAAAADGSIRGWNVTENTLDPTVWTPKLVALAAHPTENLLAGGGQDGSIRILQWPPVAPATLAGPTGPVKAVAISSDGKMIAVGSGTAKQNLVYLFDADGKSLRNLDVQKGTIESIALSLRQQLLASVNTNGLIKLSSSIDGTSIQTFSGHRGAVRDVAFHPKENKIASAGDDGTIRIWALRTEKSQAPRFLDGHTGPVTKVAISADGRAAATISTDKTMRLWSLDTEAKEKTQDKDKKTAPGRSSKEILKVELPQTPTAFALSNDGKQIAAADAQGMLGLYDRAKGKSLATLGAHEKAITVLDYHPKSKLLLSASDDGTVKLWDVTAPQPVILEGHTEAVSTLVLSSDGKTVFSGGADKTLRSFDVSGEGKRAFKELRLYKGQALGIISLALRADDKLVATGSGGGIIKFWDTSNGTEKFQLHAHQGAVHGLAFHPKGNQIASSGADGTIRLWRLPKPAKLLAGHTGPVQAVAVSPNGKILATAADDKTVRLWNVADGKPLRTLSGHTGPVTALSFKGDSTQLATASTDKTARLWNVANGKQIADFKEHAAQLAAVAFAPDGTQIATGGADKQIKLWNVSDRKLLRTIQSHNGPITCLAFTPDGKVILSGSSDGYLRTFMAADGKPQHKFHHGAAIHDVRISGDGKWFISAGEDKVAKLWKSSGGSAAATFSGHTEKVVGVAFDKKNETIATCSSDGTVRIWDLQGQLLERFASEKPTCIAFSRRIKDRGEKIFVGGLDHQVRQSHRSLIRLIKASKGPILSVAFTPDGTKLASGASDKTVQLWNLTDGTSFKSFTGSTKGIYNVAVSNDGKLLAACGAENFVRVWRIADGGALQNISLPAHARDVHFSADSTKLVAGCDDNIVRVWDLTSGKLLELFKGHTGAVSGVRFAADNKTIISGSADKQLRVWKLSAQKVFVAESGPVKDAVFSADGKHILTGGKDKIIKFWDHRGKLVRSLTGCASEITRLARSSDGQMAACFGSAAKIVYLWNLAAQENTPAHVLTAPNKVTSLSFSADHKKLAIGSSDKHLRIYRTKDMLLLEDITAPAEVKDVVFAPNNKTLVCAAGNQVLVLSDSLLRIIAGHQGAVTCLAFSPDGKALVSGGADNTVRQWDLVSGKQTHAYEGNTAAVTSLSISRDGKRIATGSADNSARLWNRAENTGGGNMKKVQPLSAITHPAAVLSVGFNPDGSRLTTGSADNMIRIWDIATGKELERLVGHSKPVHAVSFLPDGRTLVSGSADNTARRWTTSVLRCTQAHPRAIRSLKFSADGAQLFSIGNQQRTVSRWSTATLKPTGKFEGATAPPNSLAISRKGTIVAAGGNDQHVRVWNADDGKLLATIKTPSPITSLVLDSAGTKVITAGTDKIIRNFALSRASGKYQLSLTHQAEGHTEAITALAMSADDHTLYSMSTDKSLKRWYVASDAARLNLKAHKGPVFSVALSHDGTQLATAGAEGAMILWSTEDGKQLVKRGRHGDQVLGVAFHPRDTRLATCGLDQSVRLFDAKGNLTKTLTEGIDGGLYSIAFSPDGTRLLTAGVSRKWQLWALEQDKPWSESPSRPYKTISGHNEAIYCAVYNRAGTRVATIDYSGKLFIWDHEGQQLFHQQLPVLAAYALAYSPDGKQLAIATQDPRLIILSVPAKVQ